MAGKNERRALTVAPVVFTMSDKTPYEAALLQFIKASILDYRTYKDWIVGNPDARGFKMHIDRRDWELAATFYRVARRQSIIHRNWRLKS